MSKKYFIAVAKIIAAEPDRPMRERLARRFGDLFQASNPNFDRLRFERACGA